jgi:hypothetical protein
MSKLPPVAAPLLTTLTALVAAGRRTLAHPVAPEAHAELQRLLHEVPERSPLYSRDGLLPNAPDLTWVGWGGSSMSRELSLWREQLRLEDAKDTTVAWQTLRVDPRDGALFRDGGGAFPVTEHALGQVANVLQAGTPARGLGPALSPATYPLRAHMLVELQARSKRKLTDPVVIRTAKHIVRRGNAFEARSRANEGHTREVRAIVTPRHAGVHFDDGVLAGRLEKLTRDTARALVRRSPLGTETRGWVELSGGDVREVVSFRNSETGQARLGFWGSCYITVLDSVITRPGDVASVDVALAGDRHERNHTLPTVGTKALHEAYGVPSEGPLTEEHRRIIAEGRIDESFRRATDAAKGLVIDWAEAQKAFPANLTTTEATAMQRLPGEGRSAALLDWCEENGLSLGKDRERLAAVMADDTRLTKVPFASAAYFAAAYALLATRPVTRPVPGAEEGKVEEVAPNWADSHRLQVEAGRWVSCRFDLKAWRASRGEE